jgi:hypothetical protein
MPYWLVIPVGAGQCIPQLLMPIRDAAGLGRFVKAREADASTATLWTTRAAARLQLLERFAHFVFLFPSYNRTDKSIHF